MVSLLGQLQVGKAMGERPQQALLMSLLPVRTGP